MKPESVCIRIRNAFGEINLVSFFTTLNRAVSKRIQQMNMDKTLTSADALIFAKKIFDSIIIRNTLSIQTQKTSSALSDGHDRFIGSEGNKGNQGKDMTDPRVENWSTKARF
jgi:hypothetical protein